VFTVVRLPLFLQVLNERFVHFNIKCMQLELVLLLLEHQTQS
jgi:hypothetical protein